MQSNRSQNVTLNQGIESLRSQIANSKNGRGKHSKYLPCVFTRNGAAMLGSVLRSETAVGISATIHTRYNEQFLTDLKKHNAQYPEKEDYLTLRYFWFLLFGFSGSVNSR